jgi:HEAT repeat protein
VSALAALAVVVVAGCKETCLRYVTDARQRANLCGRCFTQSDRATWAELLAVASPQLAPELLEDDDWAVRWSAVRALAKKDAVTEPRALADWVDKAPGGELKPCATALHVAGARHEPLGKLLRPAAAAKCWSKRDALKTQVELDLYSPEPTVRHEALAHLAAFAEKAPARVVLDAMQTRSPETDELTAALLREAAAPAGKALLEAPKTEADTPLVNRLLAVYAKQIDALRPKLHDPEPMVRRETLHALAEMAPLSGPELEGALEDLDGTVRRAAADGLARGEGSSVVWVARKKLTAKWLALAGASGDPDCKNLLEDAVFNEQLGDDVRAAALPALVDCEGGRALPSVNKLLASPLPRIRAGAARALGLMPRVPPAEKMLQVLFDDRDPGVLAAAAHAAGALRVKTLVPKVVDLTGHLDPDVRLEAVNALVALEATGSAPRLAKQLATDSDARVRAACANALGELGGTSGIPALIEASKSDLDPKVKFVAGESLRRLGFKKREP